MQSSNQSSVSSSSNRFSLILLEPGEIYFEDYLVYYHELKCPFSEETSIPTKSLTKSPTTPSRPFTSPTQQLQFNFNSPNVPLEQNNIKQLKGNLKICSKSIVFDPNNIR